MSTVNQRVEIPAWTDAWARGDRFGIITGTTMLNRVLVKLDKSGHVQPFYRDELRVIDVGAQVNENLRAVGGMIADRGAES